MRNFIYYFPVQWTIASWFIIHKQSNSLEDDPQVLYYVKIDWMLPQKQARISQHLKDKTYLCTLSLDDVT